LSICWNTAVRAGSTRFAYKFRLQKPEQTACRQQGKSGGAGSLTMNIPVQSKSPSPPESLNDSDNLQKPVKQAGKFPSLLYRLL